MSAYAIMNVKTWKTNDVLQVSTNVGGFRFPHGLNSTSSNDDHDSATALTSTKAVRCTLRVWMLMPPTTGCRRARWTMSGVASAHGSHDTNSLTNTGSHG